MAARGPAGGVIIVCVIPIHIYIFGLGTQNGFSPPINRPRTPDSAREIQTRQQFYQPIAVATTHGFRAIGVLKVIFAYYGKLTNKA